MRKLKIQNEEDIKDILELYNSRTPISHIAKKYNVYHQNIVNILKKYEGYNPSNITFKNHNYFNNIDSHTKAYLAGFIAADGSIIGEDLTITIHSKDRIVLDVLKHELISTNDIQVIDQNGLDHVRFATRSKELTSGLMAIGIMPNKSLTMKNIIPNIPKEFRNSFILGYFDGDGSINVREVFSNKGYSRKHSVQIRATKEFALGIIEELGIESFHLSDETMPNLAISSFDEIKKIYSKIYANSEIYLSRKRDKFLITLYRSINNTLYRELYSQHIHQDQTISYSY